MRIIYSCKNLFNANSQEFEDFQSLTGVKPNGIEPNGIEPDSFSYVCPFVPLYSSSHQIQGDEIIVTKGSSRPRHGWSIVYTGELRQGEQVCMLIYEAPS